VVVSSSSTVGAVADSIVVEAAGTEAGRIERPVAGRSSTTEAGTSAVGVASCFTTDTFSSSHNQVVRRTTVA